MEDGESVEQACLREYLDETGLVLKCDRLAIVHEYFCNNNRQPIHEYGFYSFVGPAIDTGAQPAVKSLEEHMQFRWHSLSKLEKIDFVPPNLQDYLLDHPDDTLFVSTNDKGP